MMYDFQVFRAQIPANLEITNLLQTDKPRTFLSFYLHGWTVVEQRRSSCRGAIAEEQFQFIIHYSLRPSPDGLAVLVFQHNPHGIKLITDTIGLGPVFILSRLIPGFN